MKVTKIFCDRCRKEIEGDPVKIIPELAGAVLEERQREKDYCRCCCDKTMAFLNGMAENSDFEAAVEEMIRGECSDQVQKPAPEEKKTETYKGGATVKQQILELAAQGMSLSEIAIRMGKTYGHVWQVVNRDKKSREKAGKVQTENTKTVCCTDEIKKKCIYGNTNGEPSCDFINKTGHSRGCDPEQCTEFVKGKRGGKRSGRINDRNQ